MEIVAPGEKYIFQEVLEYASSIASGYSKQVGTISKNPWHYLRPDLPNDEYRPNLRLQSQRYYS